MKGRHGGAGRPGIAVQGRSGQGRTGMLVKAGEGFQAHWAGQSREAGRVQQKGQTGQCRAFSPGRQSWEALAEQGRVVQGRQAR